MKTNSLIENVGMSLACWIWREIYLLVELTKELARWMWNAPVNTSGVKRGLELVTRRGILLLVTLLFLTIASLAIYAIEKKLLIHFLFSDFRFGG
jgi:hypothetical protein